MENTTCQPEIEDLKVIKLLYKTKLSSIWLAKYLDNYVILKGKKRSELSNDDFESLKRERNFLESNANNEKRNKFPHFIKSAKDDHSLYMIINFIEGATLSSLHRENIFKFNLFNTKEDFIIKKNVFLTLVSQILNYIDVLHEDGFIYRDLKLNNIVINKKLELFLIDFGFVKQLSSDDGRTKSICGTYHSFAPEIFRTKFGIQEDYDISVDIYSFGVLLYELFTSKPPFPYLFEIDDAILKNYFDQISQGLKEEIHFNSVNFCNVDNQKDIDEATKFAEDLKDLIKGCMNIDVEKRYSLEQIKRHNIFINDYSKFLDHEKIDNDINWVKDIVDSVDFNGDFIETYEFSEEDVFDKFF